MVFSASCGLFCLLWQISVERHALTLEKQQWDERVAVTNEVLVEQYQDGVVVLEADGGALRTTVATLCEGREPKSTLAALVREQWRRAPADAAAEAAGQGGGQEGSQDEGGQEGVEANGEAGAEEEQEGQKVDDSAGAPVPPEPIIAAEGKVADEQRNRQKAAGGEAAGGEEVRLFLDRDAAAMQWLIAWLRDGDATIEAMPRAVLQVVA